MSDPRLTPDPARITGKTARQIITPVADLCRSPDGPRDRQLLLGAAVTALDSGASWTYVQAQRDGYCGYVGSDCLGAPMAPTHKVIAPASHAYQDANMKSPDQMRASFGARVSALGTSDKFIETAHGFFPKQHLAPVDETATDPAQIAALFLGTPYLWGGNSRDGIDCSGLVQAAFHACGFDCPGDSDMQEQSLGARFPQGTPPQRNDLLFWKGHVALVCDQDTLIHANAHAMAVSFEPIAATIARIIAAGGGPVTSHRRPDFPIGHKSPPEA
ncbi:MAG: C40 family peptidase [Sulfitobacter sp.]